ncbi:uncharacterized protein LOC142334000 [Lycorma delicatula]|uniref:uncharacterized protein LOC142334000 n=1 Tax=Lycorma delicatula TaxID=130591 RepID=UPI003F510011
MSMYILTPERWQSSTFGVKKLCKVLNIIYLCSLLLTNKKIYYNWKRNCDVSNGDIEKDPLAIEETDLIKSENLKVENKVQVDLLQLKEELLDINNGDIEKDPLAIEETNLVENEAVTVSKETIKGNTKHCITCKRCINNSVHDGITKKKCECKCASGDVTTEENLVKNVIRENNLPIQKGKKLVCDCCDERFKCKCYLKRNINFHGKNKKNNSNFCQKSLIHDNNIKTHLMHNEEKNYICNFCQKTFNDRSNLKSHLNIHSKEKNYVCNFCQKVFINLLV